MHTPGLSATSWACQGPFQEGRPGFNSNHKPDSGIVLTAMQVTECFTILQALGIFFYLFPLPVRHVVCFFFQGQFQILVSFLVLKVHSRRGRCLLPMKNPHEMKNTE